MLLHGGQDGGQQEIVRDPNTGGDETLYFHSDHLASPSTITNQSGEPTFTKTGPFGAPRSVVDPEISRVGFTGHQQDRDLELIDMRGRVYDPLAGRFMQPDPVMQAPFWTQGLNRYTYVFNDPLNSTDPSGFVSEEHHTGAGILMFGMPPAPGIGTQLMMMAYGMGTFNLAGGAAGAGIVVLGNMLGIGKMTASTEVSRPNPTQAPRNAGSTPNAGGAPAQNKGGVGPATRPPVPEQVAGYTSDPPGTETILKGMDCLAEQCREVIPLFDIRRLSLKPILEPIIDAVGNVLQKLSGAEKVPERAKPPAPPGSLSKLKIDPKTVLSGGRGGGNVKNLVGPPNSAVRGGGQRAFITNDKGQVILDITKTRVKPVAPGSGFGPKRAPTPQELDILNKVLGGAL